MGSDVYMACALENVLLSSVIIVESVKVKR